MCFVRLKFVLSEEGTQSARICNARKTVQNASVYKHTSRYHLRSRGASYDVRPACVLKFKVKHKRNQLCMGVCPCVRVSARVCVRVRVCTFCACVHASVVLFRSKNDSPNICWACTARVPRWRYENSALGSRFGLHRSNLKNCVCFTAEFELLSPLQSMYSAFECVLSQLRIVDAPDMFATFVESELTWHVPSA